MSKQTQLENLAQDILDQDVCSELRLTATQLVMGEGTLDAEVVFVGEAPGKREDLLGRPFVGASGKFLDEMLTSVDLNREDVYITNIVKYRPPNNRDPKGSEVMAFLPYLLQQLELIKPKLIVTLGRFSMNVFLPKAKIGNIHGQPHRVWLDGSVFSEEIDETFASVSSAVVREGEGIWTILPLYHPAAALYNGAKRQVLLEDFALIPKILSK